MSDTSQGPGWWQASDGKWYPPAVASGAPPTGLPAPEKKGRGLKVGLIVACLLIAGVIAVVVATTMADDAEREAAAQDDVEILSCDSIGNGSERSMVALLRITNNSSVRSLYVVKVAFDGPDGSEIDDSIGLAELDPGESTNVPASTTDATVPAEFDCRVVDVNSSG